MLKEEGVKTVKEMGHQIKMHFWIFVKCDLCKGNRFNRETLEIKFKNKSISDVLDMTVEEGLNFKAIPSIS